MKVPTPLAIIIPETSSKSSVWYVNPTYVHGCSPLRSLSFLTVWGGWFPEIEKIRAAFIQSCLPPSIARNGNETNDDANG